MQWSRKACSLMCFPAGTHRVRSPFCLSQASGICSVRLTCSSAMSACEKGMRWEHALAVLSLLVQRTLPLGRIAETKLAMGDVLYLPLHILTRSLLKHGESLTLVPSTEYCMRSPCHGHAQKNAESRQPDAVSFNAAIEACSGAGQWPIVGELMRSALQFPGFLGAGQDQVYCWARVFTNLLQVSAYGLSLELRSSGGFAIAAYDHSVQAGSSVDCFKHLVTWLSHPQS